MKTFYSILILLVFFFHNIFGQIEEIKQITNFNSDSRNPNFYNSVYHYPQSPFITFELHSDSSSEILISSYDIENDKFELPVFITNNGANNTNPIGMAFGEFSDENSRIIMWQTDIRGNLDLVYKEYSINNFNDYSVGDEQYLTESLSDENDFSFMISPRERLFEIVYEREGSIFLYSKTNSSEQEELVFQSNDNNIRYSQPTGTNYYKYNSIFGQAIATVEKSDSNSSSRIIYKYRVHRDSSWSEIKVLYDSTNCQKPKFFDSLPDNQLTLAISFEAIIKSKTKILYYNFVQDYGNNSLVLEYYDDYEVETSNFSSYLADTGITWGPAFWSVPNSAKIIRNDSTFILSPAWSGFETYDEISIKYAESKHRIGNLGSHGMSGITYTIWEDSTSDGIINLFGKGRYEIAVDVKDQSVPTEFVLEQNYPNPFNPSTTINYSIPVETFRGMSATTVTLKIFDILGREVATLVNKEQSPGSYSISFDASSLTSGMYFYKLQYGTSVQTKKMMLLK